MDKTTKSLTISQLIEALQQVQKDEGDKEIVLSSDPEGNSFGTISSEDAFGAEGKDYIVLYPSEQFTDF